MRGYAVVDVETSGLMPADDRVLSVAVVTTDIDARVQETFSTLLNPGCDPGAVWIHGLTKRRLRGSPQFDHVFRRLSAMLEGRVLVAHNAQFDYGFLLHEARRTGSQLPTSHRLCTIALSRRLNLPVANYQLSTIASYWNVRQVRAHDSVDDARVLAAVFERSLTMARQYDVPLPVLECTGRGDATYATAVPRVPCAFSNPPAWSWGSPLVQGMKVAISGPTVKPREHLSSALVGAGLDVMNNLSSQTRLLIVNDPRWTSSKVRKARELGVAMAHENAVLPLLDRVEAGELKGVRSTTSRPAAAVATGPWHGTRVLVLGGNHDEAAAVRARISEYGARILLTLGATTTHVVLLPGGEHDPRMRKIRERRLITLTPDQVTADGVRAQDQVSEPQVLVRGQVIDLPADSAELSVSAAWTPHPGIEVDLVAIPLDADEAVTSDEDLVFYNAPVSPTGGLNLTVDGDAEQAVTLNFENLPADCARIVIAAAIDGATFGDLGPISVAIGQDGGEIATSVLDAATDEASLVLIEVYLRGDVWRLRAVGRGYETGLRDLVERYGVQVDEA